MVAGRAAALRRIAGSDAQERSAASSMIAISFVAFDHRRALHLSAGHEAARFDTSCMPGRFVERGTRRDSKLPNDT